MTDTRIPPAIQQFVDATNRGDSAAFVEAFADDAYLNDWGREFHGRDGVASWNDTDNIGRNAHFDVHGIVAGRKPDQYLLTVTVSGEGYNGPGTFTFDLRDGLIARFLIA
ncbi:nuclear transport factor 2 family protein [Agromyces aurantiacus]|uniref:Nuclear transport factor 2 family protein n=1 Tax=Agromyces aurantiacus TaxID=165814 RepID=A0ABV9R4M9_9MICO|nr:nuclear transport factor 2 family protein [Agromyces aurantiacus]MBM7503619.1 ketosteroid isomerase-like protein [Agromyces aurantiacus]